MFSLDLDALGDPFERQGQAESGADVYTALHHNGAAHQGRQIATDRKAEAGASETARCRGVRLGEFLEQPARLFGRHADPRVGDPEHKAAFRVRHA